MACNPVQFSAVQLWRGWNSSPACGQLAFLQEEAKAHVHLLRRHEAAHIVHSLLAVCVVHAVQLAEVLMLQATSSALLCMGCHGSVEDGFLAPFGSASRKALPRQLLMRTLTGMVIVEGPKRHALSLVADSKEFQIAIAPILHILELVCYHLRSFLHRQVGPLPL